MRNSGFGRTVVVGAIFWIVIAGIVLVQIWPTMPETYRDWLVFVAIAPPIYVLLEALGAWIFSEKHGFALSSGRFSLLRIAVATIAVILLLAFWLVLEQTF